MVVGTSVDVVTISTIVDEAVVLKTLVKVDSGSSLVAKGVVASGCLGIV